jgi:hypothetical protein
MVMGHRRDAIWSSFDGLSCGRIVGLLGLLHAISGGLLIAFEDPDAIF